jgi:hypothetical protein
MEPRQEPAPRQQRVGGSDARGRPAFLSRPIVIAPGSELTLTSEQSAASRRDAPISSASITLSRRVRIRLRHLSTPHRRTESRPKNSLTQNPTKIPAIQIRREPLQHTAAIARATYTRAICARYSAEPCTLESGSTPRTASAAAASMRLGSSRLPFSARSTSAGR